MQIKHGLPVHISDEAYDMLRHLLSFTYDEGNDRYHRSELYSQISHTGSLQTVNAPALPSLYAVIMKGKKEMAKFQLETSDDGIAVTLDMVKTAEHILQHHDCPVPPDMDEADLKPEDRIPAVMQLLISGDGCRWQSSRPCTTIGIQAVGLQEKGSKIVIASTQSVLVVEAHDDYHSVRPPLRCCAESCCCGRAHLLRCNPRSAHGTLFAHIMIGIRKGLSNKYPET